MSPFGWYIVGVVLSSLSTIVLMLIGNDLRIQRGVNHALGLVESRVRKACHDAYKQGWHEGNEEGYTAGYVAGKLDPHRDKS